jgi:intein/homing endonuclease
MVLLKRKVDKLKSTFIDAVYDKRDKNDVVHPRYNVIGTDSGRISSCVRRGTLVETSTGKRPIEELKAGDLVYGDDFNLHECTVNAFEKPAARFYQVTLEDGSTIECTAAHRFKTQNGWKKLSELCEGDDILWYNNSQDVPTTTNSA